MLAFNNGSFKDSVWEFRYLSSTEIFIRNIFGSKCACVIFGTLLKLFLELNAQILELLVSKQNTYHGSLQDVTFEKQKVSVSNKILFFFGGLEGVYPWISA